MHFSREEPCFFGLIVKSSLGKDKDAVLERLFLKKPFENFPGDSDKHDLPHR